MSRYIAHLSAVTICAFLCASFFATPAYTQSTNLISNGDFETESSPGTPSGWTRGRWGTNTTTFTYPAEGVAGGRGASITMTARTSGDAKWAFPRVSITPGAEYEFSNQYKATVSTFVTLEYEHTDGTLTYVDIAQPSPASAFTENRFRFTAPANVRAVTVFHLINTVGTLTVDRYALQQTENAPPPPPPGDPDNLVPNPSFEELTSTGQPLQWGKGKWGTNNATFSFPIAGFDGPNAARVDIGSYTSGDAKWHFPELSTQSGQGYTFSDAYRSNVTTRVTVQFRMSDGSRVYTDLPNAPASAAFRTYTASFTAPQGATTVTVFHVLNRTGFLEVDAYSLVKSSATPPPPDPRFTKGHVSIHFDDGWRSVYDNALPILDAAGFKSTHFITTEYLQPTFPGYIKPAQLRDIAARGHEIGAHTRTHQDLTTLTTTQARGEIAGSRQDLFDVGITPVNFFAYPFGAYNTQVINLVKEAGFKAARSSDGGNNLRTEDIWTLNRFPMTNSVTFTQVKNAIDKAMTERSWIILLFHEVDTNTHTYNVTPALFQQIIDYLESQNIVPITMEQGLQLMQQ